jgi:hypothetical protein
VCECVLASHMHTHTPTLSKRQQCVCGRRESELACVLKSIELRVNVQAESVGCAPRCLESGLPRKHKTKTRHTLVALVAAGDYVIDISGLWYVREYMN